jgi:hypothetical protein
MYRAERGVRPLGVVLVRPGLVDGAGMRGVEAQILFVPFAHSFCGTV